MSTAFAVPDTATPERFRLTQSGWSALVRAMEAVGRLDEALRRSGTETRAAWLVHARVCEASASLRLAGLPADASALARSTIVSGAADELPAWEAFGDEPGLRVRLAHASRILDVYAAWDRPTADDLREGGNSDIDEPLATFAQLPHAAFRRLHALQPWRDLVEYREHSTAISESAHVPTGEAPDWTGRAIAWAEAVEAWAEFPPLVQAALAHSFAADPTTMPVPVDGELVGRALMVPLLRDRGLLRSGLLPIAAGYLDARLSDRDPGRRPAAVWVRDWLDAAAAGAAVGLRLLDRLERADRRLGELGDGRRRNSRLLDVGRHLLAVPAATQARVCAALGLTPAAALKHLAALESAGVIVEIAGRQAWRVWRANVS